MTSRERYGVPKHRQLDCYFYTLFRLTKEISSSVSVVLCGENPPAVVGFHSQSVKNTHDDKENRSKKTPKLRVTGLCAGNSPGTGEFPAQMASNAEEASIWWRHHDSAQYHIVHFIVYQSSLCSESSQMDAYLTPLGKHFGTKSAC